MKLELLDKKEVLQAIADEPEYPGRPPILMTTIGQILALEDPELVSQGMLLIAQMAVKQTKACIAERINGLKTKEGK